MSTKIYDFDKVTDRRGSGCLKYGELTQRFGREDLLPLWIADMDFETPDFIISALEERLRHPVFGYTMLPAEFKGSIKKWVADHHGWNVQEEWISFIPGIVRGIAMVIDVFTGKGDKVIIQPPVYHPFRIVTCENNREVVYNPLREVDGTYEMDFDNLERVADDKCKLLILSNPHNPAGICWSKETLARLATFCKEHNIIVISDEIHCDMALFGHKHIPFASVSDEAADISITFQAASKTFNIAGLVGSYAIVPNEGLRREFFHWMSANEMNNATLFAPIATIAAYQNGEEWRRQMLSYIEKNVCLVCEYCARHIPRIKPRRPQASFLIWLDCRALELDHEGLIDLFVNKAHLALNDGEMFGIGGEGFMRLNIGTPSSTLLRAMEQLSTAVASI